jgi:hypothetical protein
LFLNDQPEKINAKNLEQDFIDSNPEAWTASRDTTFDKEGSNNNETSKDEKKSLLLDLQLKSLNS